jgi:predicted ATPase/class 3 adenylate cyclase
MLTLMRGDFPSGTVTFLFTDIEGSTKLLHELGAERYAKALGAHRNVIRKASTARGGVEVDTEGDAFFVAFPTAQGALEAAAGFIQELESGPIRVRVGVHTGTPLLAEDNYVGMDVHRAARIAASGHGGQVLVSASTAALTGTDGLRDLGEHRFKDLSAPERVYQLGDREFPPLKSLYRTNLPVPVTPFLGRDRELQEVGELLTRDDVRLLTLIGPGGTGKTRLAAQAAGIASDEYPDGVYWVPLAPLRNPSLVLSAIAHALEIDEEPGVSVAETLLSDLAGKHMLLLLDNAEHLLPEAADELAMLATTPGPVFLVTSRERLQLQSEHLYPVPTLADPDGVELFLSRARALEPGFSANGEVAELCSRLENLPLALELAAARTTLFTPQQLLERLATRLDLLKGGRDVDPRQQTLRATIEWSYDLLSDDEQRRFRGISVFAGGCTYEAAEEVCGADPDSLQALLDKSLLRRRDSELGPRYWMLETIREYALELLQAAGEAGQVMARHARWYLDRLEEIHPVVAGPRTGEFLKWYESEAGNVSAALDAFVRERDAECGLRLATAARQLSLARGRSSEARAALERTLELDGGSNRARAAATHALGDVLDRQGEASEAARLYERALALAETSSDRDRVALVLTDLSWVMKILGRYENALEYAQRARAVGTEIGNERAVAISWSHEGLTELELGEPARARVALERCLDFFRKTGDEINAGTTLINIGETFLAEGQSTVAAGYFEQAIEILRPFDHPTLAVGLRGLAQAAAKKGGMEHARELCAESLEIHTSAGDKLGVAYCLECMAMVSARAEPEDAARLLGAAEALRELIGIQLSPSETAQYSDVVGALREVLGPRATPMWAAGRTLTFEQAITLALEVAHYGRART